MRTAWGSKKLAALWESLWFVPTVISVFGVALGLFMPWLDRALFGDGPPTGMAQRLVPGPGAAEALVSNALAGLATILGVAFSITVVTLQLAATQYTSRLLRRFMADPLTRVVFGVYLAAISYLAVVLRTIEQPSQGDPGFVPSLSVTLALVAFIACIVLLAVFIHHLARSIQAGPIIGAVGKDTIGVIYKEREGRPLVGSSPERSPPVPDEPACVLRSKTPGYLQLVNEDELLDAAPRGCSVLRVDAHVGQFLLRGSPLVSLWPNRPLDEETQQALRGAMALGVERTTHQDVLYGVRQLVDVGLKALSPAVNDVHTAVMVVNELGAVGDGLLQRFEGRTSAWRELRRDGLTLYVPELDLKTFLRHAFDEMPRAGMAHPIVIARLLEVLAELSERTEDKTARALLVETGLRVSQYIEQGDYVPGELRLLRKMQASLERGRVERDPDMSNPV